MLKSAIVRLWCMLFLLQTGLSTFPAMAATVDRNARDPLRSKQYEAELTLDAANSSASFLGLEIFSPQHADLHAPIKLRVECFGADETPPLALDASVYDEDSRLVNFTGRSLSGCTSYQVDVADFDVQRTDGSVDESRNIPPRASIAVSIEDHAASNYGGSSPAVFIFNPVHGNWTSAKSFTPPNPTPGRSYATLSESHQRIISGVIVTPNKMTADPVSNSPPSISGALGAVKPTSGYLSLGDLMPDSKGNFSKPLPLLLRPSRGAGPSFSVAYNSNGYAGVLGRGWDLSTSGISVKGTSPLYHPDFETEDYVLDGQELIAFDARGKDIPPLYKGGPIIHRIKGERAFHLRNNSSGLIVRRFGDSPDSYYWVVWDPHSKLTRLYGAHRDAKPRISDQGFEVPAFNSDGNGLLKGIVAFGGRRGDGRNHRSVIGEWGLTQEYDNQPARNGTVYTYYIEENLPSTCDPIWGAGAQCSPALRLDNVVYNLSLAIPLSDASSVGVTLVHFGWKKRSDSKRFNSDGRLGFLRAYEFWLNEITVWYTAKKGDMSLVSVHPDEPLVQSYKMFSSHLFTLTEGDDPCTDFDVLLSKYTVGGNGRYDLDDPPASRKASSESQDGEPYGQSPQTRQTFSFKYHGQDHCNATWTDTQNMTLANPEGQLANAPATNLGFPSKLLNDLGLGLLTDMSLLGTSQSLETGASLYVGVGPTGRTDQKPTSVGVKAGVSEAKSEVGSSLFDVTGDGIADIVYHVGGRLKYCAGTRNGIRIDYASERCGDVEGISDLGISTTSSESAGLEAYTDGAFAGVGSTSSENQTYVYLTDRDGDGLADLVAYGRIYYGLGEDPDRKHVRFSANKSLTPPIPQQVDHNYSVSNNSQQSDRNTIQIDGKHLVQRVPDDAQSAVVAAGRRLEHITQDIQRLDYSQSTISWEAPLDGRVAISGSLKLSEGNQGFRKLKSDADSLRQYYYDCSNRPSTTDCYAEAANPYEPHFVRPEGSIAFIDTPSAFVQIAMSRKPTGSAPGAAVLQCTQPSEISKLHAVDLSSLAIDSSCAGTAQPGSTITVKAGDVIYLTYSVDPDATAHVIPSAKISYEWVDNDYAFDFTRGNQPDTISPLLNCGWSDQSSVSFARDCLLRSQSRYSYDLDTASLTTAPGTAVELHSGSHRVFGGKFEISAAITRDYNVYLDIFAADVAAAIGSRLPLLFRQSVSDSCSTISSEICIVDVAPSCAMGLSQKCDQFLKDDAPAARVSSRLVIEHKGLNDYPARNVSSRLNTLRWRIPPFVDTSFSEVTDSGQDVIRRPSEVGSLAPQTMRVYLPISMGDDDQEHERVGKGVFPNPNPELNERAAKPDEVDFSAILDAERENVKVARARQLSQLCHFATEIIDFLDSRSSANAAPYAEEYGSYWRTKYAKYQPNCTEADEYLASLSFTTKQTLDTSYAPRLNLPHLLRNLEIGEQISSSENLLERVFANLQLPREILMDDPKVTRRGYRLPAKVNPLGCDILSSNSAPIGKAIFGDEATCKFRMLSNFAMADLDKLIGSGQANNIRKQLSQIIRNPQAAFEVELTATSNGKPVLFRELSGESTGNLGCADVPTNTCLGNYGSFSRLEDHLYPNAKGDMFQRILTNRRSGRAVAFSDDVMDLHNGGVCIRSSHRYSSVSSMEAKQDCSPDDASLADSQKYVGTPAGKITYKILEDNTFQGRNRVIEFDATPLDVLELHLKLIPVTRTIQLERPGGPVQVRGNFSVLIVDSKLSIESGLNKGNYLIPRSPLDLVDVSSVVPECAMANSSVLAANCRPWSKLGWTEILLGAQYRTLSDAHETINNASYSVLRRRDLLRIHPEIEVPAESYHLNIAKGGRVPTAEELYDGANQGAAIADITQLGLNAARSSGIPAASKSYPKVILAGIERTPNIPKVGANWSLFASRHAKDGKLVLPKDYGLLRYGNDNLIPSGTSPRDQMDNALEACGHGNESQDRDFDSCQQNFAGTDVDSNLRDVSVIPLVHRFVGPVSALSDRDRQEQTIDNNAIAPDPCRQQNPKSAASCWMGQDDSIYTQRRIDDLPDGPRPPFYSVSALVGFEEPPIIRFRNAYGALCKLLLSSDNLLSGDDPHYRGAFSTVCLDHRQAAPAGQQLTAEQVLPSSYFPNRPAPPATNRIIEVFGPVQSSKSQTMSFVGAIGPVNSVRSWTRKQTSQLLLDVNGDGYPDTISNGKATLTSPVGLSRRDWWRYFREDTEAPGLGAELTSGGLDQSSRSGNAGAGIGVSPSTFAKAEPKATNTHTSGSPDGSVEPSFDLSFEQGQDNTFRDLRDFNGDGIVDQLNASTVSNAISTTLNTGNTLGATVESGAPAVSTIGGFSFSNYYNTSHGAGFGVRLGYSYAYGSFMAGAGISHRDSTSEGALMDFNGDGRVDIVLPATKDGNNYLTVFPNLGNGYGPARTYEIAGWENSESGASETTLVDADAAFTFGVNLTYVKIVWNPSAKHANDQSRELVQIRDMDGDGVPDIATVSGRFTSADNNGVPDLRLKNLETRIHHNPDARYYLLSKVEEPSGITSYLSYGLYGNTGPENGTSTWALTSVGRFDGFEPTQAPGKLSPDGQDVDLSVYDYNGGYYNRAERQFYGFSQRTTKRYGCDLADDRAYAEKKCLSVLASNETPTQALLAGSGYRELQIATQTFSNRDYLTQGIQLSESVVGFNSEPQTSRPTQQGGTSSAQLVSQSTFGYSIDDLATILPATDPDEDKKTCAPPDLAGSDVTWSVNEQDSHNALQTGSSVLPKYWNGSQYGTNGSVFGGGEPICEAGVDSCAASLRNRVCNQGFNREQTAFWAQQSGSVRKRFEVLETGTEPVNDNGQPLPEHSAAPQHLMSAIAFDHDQWGQVLSFDSIGELTNVSRRYIPVDASSVHARIGYARRQGPSSKLGTLEATQATGYPLLDLPDSLEIYSGPWAKPANDNVANEPLRVREALYANDGTGNLTDVCQYPGGDGFRFNRNARICQSYKDAMGRALSDGYSSMEFALRTAYAQVGGLPKGVDTFNAVIHDQVAAYDAYGNATHVISSLSANKEWMERRFSYDDDPFVMSPTTTELTRCVEDVPGAGSDSPHLVEKPGSRCTYGLENLNKAVTRKPITHFSTSEIDPQFGAVAQTKDINGNSMLYDYDRWGRLRLIARSWGNEARENRAFQQQLKLALGKSTPALREPGRPVDASRWRVLAAADFDRIVFDRQSSGDAQRMLLRSNVRGFEPSDSYNGLLPEQNTTRETAVISDGLGHTVQSIQEADVCLDALPSILDGSNPGARVDLAGRCKGIASGFVVPGTATDVLGRELQTFEPYGVSGGLGAQSSSIRFEALQYRADEPGPISATTYDSAGRPLKVENRLSATQATGDGGQRVVATTQYRYHVLPALEVANGSAGAAVRGPRFEALSLSPRCTASSSWSDARGQITDIFEDQTKFYGEVPTLPRPAWPEEDPKGDDGGSRSGSNPYKRDYGNSLANCLPIETMQNAWTASVAASEVAAGLQPARVSYEYDPLRQLTAVDSPLDGMDRASIHASYDLLGRMTEMREQNAGCVRYNYDGLQNLVSEVASRYVADVSRSCETSSKVRNEKDYRYSADRLLEMSYRSLEEQGGAKDQVDKARFFHDRFPYATLHGELIEGLKFVPNDLANQRFIDQTGLNCENCIGQVAIATDRTGARSNTYNPLGQPIRELRSIVGPLHEVKQSGGRSETYLPEVGFYQQDNAYTSFGDLVHQTFAEREPTNPSPACLNAGIQTCLAHFMLGRRYGPDGAVAQILYNGKPLISAAHDALGRPAVRWTADGTVTGFGYDNKDLRLDQMATITAAKEPARLDSGHDADDMPFIPIQMNGYQYDGGGNVLGFGNTAEPREKYRSWFDFGYDPANRLAHFNAKILKDRSQVHSSGSYTYDAGNRFKTRQLTIAGMPGHVFKRDWTYNYDPSRTTPAHAPSSIDFTINDNSLRTTAFAYDDIGQMTRVGTSAGGKETAFGVLSNRAMSWDAQGRLTDVRGVQDGAVAANIDRLREDYAYDFGGNRVLKIRPALAESRETGPGATDADDAEAATIYMTPFYARDLDGHGAVQIAEGSLPTASLSPSADESEDPVATYLYSSLAVGSVSASVTAFGEVGDAQSTVVGRREYSPFGLELTADSIAQTGRDGVGALSAFHGKELDDSAFSSFGARYYSRDIGSWISSDPMLRNYFSGAPNGGVLVGKNLSAYSFSYQNPIAFSDRNGNNPGICYSGFYRVFSCADMQVGEYWTDNFVLGAANQLINIGVSAGNAVFDPLVSTSMALEPYSGGLDALSAFIATDGVLLDDGFLALTNSRSYLAALGEARLAGRLINAAGKAAPRTFISSDPLVANLANEIELAYPGHVVGVNVPVRNALGQLITDADIQLRNAIIQVKSGGGKGLTSQLLRTEQATGMSTIGYGPTLGPSVIKSINNAGGLVTTDRAFLIELVKP
ncbi:SpvB/TcaC N-terminal domain-containing protein [Rhizobium ruizarguesonis]